jgi:hypothetical protein
MKRFATRSSVSTADLPLQKKDPTEMHGRSQENGLRFETLGRNVMQTWSQLILQTPVAIAVAAAVDFRSRNWRRDNQTGTQLQYVATAYVIRREARDQTGNGRNVYG